MWFSLELWQNLETITVMDIPFKLESEKLREAWLRHPAEFLDSYLVHGIENPCFNPQSVLLRHLIVEAVLRGWHGELARHERLYSAAACTILQAASRGLFDPFTAALEGETTGGRGLALPPFLEAARQQSGELPFSLRRLWQDLLRAMLGSYVNFASPFEALWQSALADAPATKATLLEAACGSANDLRYFPRYGLDRLVEITGVDLCAANVANARRRCPGGTFLEADALDLPFPDKSFDFHCAFDLFEHLSLEAFDRALREAVRVTRRVLWLSFFQIEWQPEHLVVPSPPYHMNVLSISKTLAALAELGCDCTVFDIPAQWAVEFPGYQHYNPRARIIAARLPGT